MSDAKSIPLHLAQAILTVDLGAMAANWRALRDKVAPAECGAVVKADAYGTGMEHAAPALAAAGCRTFFVAQASEGVRLRQLLPDRSMRIYVMNGIAGDVQTAAVFSQHGLRPVIGSFHELRQWRENSVAPTQGMALQFSTGMNRLGFAPLEAGQVAALLAEDGAPVCDFVMSHFISSEEADNPINGEQISAFESISRHFTGLPRSLANSSGIFLPQAPFLDLVRPGYALYGGNPAPGRVNPMRAVVKLEARVLQLRQVQKGERAGYNAIWTAARPSRLAIIGVGYGDGFLRSASASPEKPAGMAMAAGAACPIAGRVSMDLMILDVTEAPVDAVQPGMPVELLGENISIDDLAVRAGTIGYEILTGLGRRYHRRYVNAG